MGQAEEAAVSGDATLPHPADDTAAEEAVTPPEGSERSVSELSRTSALGESAVTAPQASDGTEKLPVVPQIEVPVKVKIQKQRMVIPEPVLNLGGSPATAPGKHYTLQLSGGTTQEELYRMARKHKLTNYVVYETERHGRRWYVLVAGEYATLSSANQSIKHLPTELRKNKPWVCSVKLVQEELSENEAGVINADNHQSKLKP